MTTDANGRWAVTGAAGNIGVALRTSLLERGFDLVSTDVRPAAPVGPRDSFVRADLGDLESLVDVFAGVDGVIHLGGLADEADFHDLADVNIVGTYHVLEAARRAEVPRVIFASSNHATGMYPSGTHVSPDMPPRPDSFYGVSKVAGEALCRLYADKFGVRTISVRIGSYQERPRSARERRTWLSHPDTVRAFLAAMTTSEHTAVFYGVSANADRWWDLDAGRAVGYVPLDDAAQISTEEHLDSGVPQGGVYSTPEYSTDRMRR